MRENGMKRMGGRGTWGKRKEQFPWGKESGSTAIEEGINLKHSIFISPGNIRKSSNFPENGDCTGCLKYQEFINR
jgi:hypothetical protein